MFDRRNRYYHAATIAAFIAFFIWMLLSFAIASENESNSITPSPWAIVGGLLGTIQLLIAFIYIGGQKSLKDSIRGQQEEIKELSQKIDNVLHEVDSKYRLLDEKKLDEKVHEIICPKRVGQ